MLHMLATGRLYHATFFSNSTFPLCLYILLCLYMLLLSELSELKDTELWVF